MSRATLQRTHSVRREKVKARSTPPPSGAAHWTKEEQLDATRAQEIHPDWRRICMTQFFREASATSGADLECGADSRIDRRLRRIRDDERHGAVDDVFALSAELRFVAAFVWPRWGDRLDWGGRLEGVLVDRFSRRRVDRDHVGNRRTGRRNDHVQGGSQP
jgi:hypothetical protein